MEKIISKDDFYKMIRGLSEKTQVWAPVKEADGIRIKKFSSGDEKIEFFESHSMLPPKFLFFPPKQTTFEVDGSDVVVPAEKDDFILVCSHKDLMGILELDRIMMKNPADFYYARRRELSTVISVKRGDFAKESGGDLILDDMGDYFIAHAYSSKGEELLKNDLFLEKQINYQKSEQEALSDFEKILLDSELLKDAIIWSHNKPVWDELAEICLGCGICTYVCPLCYCFSTEDEKSFDGEKCRRCRQWDSCILPDFALIAGGKNFRSELRERYYNWFYHKFVRAYHEFGRPHCVACGRCQNYCPAQIDIYKILVGIVVEYKKTLKNG